MAVFLAGVATAEIFDGSTLFASARTLIDSSITIGVTAEDVRGGEGAALIGKYFHTTTFDLKMTDALFNLAYIAANVGADITIGGDVFYNEELTSNQSREITLTATAVPHVSGGLTYAWIRRADATTDDRISVEVSGENKITVPDANTAYCIRYLYSNASAKKIVVSSNYIPSTLTVFLTANLYSGDASNPTTGTKVGTVTIKVPRFLLSGNQELSMTSTGASTTNFEGSALASGGGGCDGAGIYAEITQAMLNARWFDDAKGLIIEDSDITMTAEEAKTALEGVAPKVYAFYDNARPKLLTNAILAAQESNLGADEKSKLVFAIEAGTTALSINSDTGVITAGSAAEGTATISVVAKTGSGGSTPIPGMDAAMVITITGE